MTMESTQNALAGIAVRYQDSLLLIARLALAYIFVESAVNRIGKLENFAATFNNFQLPEVMGVPVAAVAVAIELLGALALIVGYRVREASLLMAVFVAFTIFLGHRFWEMEDAAQRMHFIHFKKNVAIIGGFFALFVAGGGRYAVSAWWAERRSVATPHTSG